MDLIMRRRSMMEMNGIPPTPEWDYYWDYTKGILNNDGWTLTQNGTGSNSATITNDYFRVQSTSANYNDYTWNNGTYSKCVIESDVYYESNQNAILLNAPGNGTYNLGVKLQYSSSYKGIYLGQSVSNTKVYTLPSYPLRIKIKLILNESLGQIYVDDSLVLDNIDTTDNVFSACTPALISFRGAGTTLRYNRLYTLKMKFGRI